MLDGKIEILHEEKKESGDMGMGWFQ